MCQSPVIKICRVGETLKVIQLKLLSEQEVFSICFVPLKFGSSLKESKMDLFEPSCCSLKTWRATKLGAKWTHAICLAGKGVKPAYSTSIINSKMYSSILCSSMFFLYDGLLYSVKICNYLRNHSTIAGPGDWSNFDFTQPARSFVYSTAPSAGSLCCNEFGQLCTGPKRQFGEWILQNNLKLTITQITWSVIGIMTTSGIKWKTPTEAHTNY